MKNEIPVGDEQLPDYSTWNKEEMLETLTDLFEGDFRGFTDHEFGQNVNALDRRVSLELFIAAMVNDGDVLASTYASKTIHLVPQDASWGEILSDTDWSELRNHKGKLSDIRYFLEQHKGKKIGTFTDPNERKSKKLTLSDEHIEAIEGILNLLDCIQDAAANEIGEDKVFDHKGESI